MGTSDGLSGVPPPGSTRSIVRLLDRLSDLGARPEDSHDERLRYGTLILASVLIALLSVIWSLPTSRVQLPRLGGDPGLLPSDHGCRARRPGADAAVRRVSLHALAVRIGIDTGPAVAGVIGRRKFIYDLWVTP